MASVQSRSEFREYGVTPADPGSFFFNGLQLSSAMNSNIPAWSIFPWHRDRALRSFWKSESLLAGTVYSLEAKIKSLNLNFTGDEAAVSFATDLMNDANFGQGYRTLFANTIQAILTQDNGFFWELIGAGSSAGQLVGPPQGVAFLDPAQCYRTFDPIHPVLYIDPIDGTRHRMHKSRVEFGSSMPQIDELSRGVGFSPVSRVLLRSQIALAIATYTSEKVEGVQRKAILHGKGVTARSLRRALNRSDSLTDAEENQYYQEIPILTTPKGVELNLLTLAGIPDNWDSLDETTLYVYILATTFGIDAREIWPATISGATKADASIQNMKARGKGFADLITTLETSLERVLKLLPGEPKGEFDFVDDEHDALVAKLRHDKSLTLKLYLDAGAITTTEMRAMGVAGGVLDPSVLDNAESLEGMQGFEEEEAAQEGTVTDAESPPTSGTIENPEAANDTVADEKAAGQDVYLKSLRAQIRALWRQSFDLDTFIEAFDSTIRRHLTRAWLEGARAVGISQEELSTTELKALQRIIAEEMSYVLGFGQEIQANERGIGKLTPFTTRAILWANRYTEVVNLAKVMSKKDQKLVWIWDPAKEHCVDCARMNGRVYRARTLEKFGVLPQSSSLACGGWRCGCSLVPTTDKATPGRPPGLTGAKWQNSQLLHSLRIFSTTYRDCFEVSERQSKASKTSPELNINEQYLRGIESLCFSQDHHEHREHLGSSLELTIESTSS